MICKFKQADDDSVENGSFEPQMDACGQRIADFGKISKGGGGQLPYGIALQRGSRGITKSPDTFNTYHFSD